MKAVINWMRREMVLCISLLCAALSCLATPPDAQYLNDLDARVLALLFCLMASVAGLGRAGLMDRLSALALRRARTQRQLALLLTLLCFFCSMVMTNDVALVAFVPLTVLLLRKAKLEALLIPVIVLETVAANLGSALTPVGNPQNLYLFSAYGMSTGCFFSVTAPLCAASLALAAGAALLLVRRGPLELEPQPQPAVDKPRLALHGALFALCLATVFSLLDWRVLLAVVVSALLAFDRPVFRRVDYALLATFACFFIFSGNLGRIPAVRGALTALMDRSAFFAALLASQAISNVPAALLLAPFTDDARAMILGANVGGLGTLVASLASLISYKIYARTPGAQPGKYLRFFTAVNLLMLLPLVALSLWLLRAGRP